MSAEIRREIAKLNSLILSDRIDRKVLSAVQTALDIRIFSQGKYANGRELGIYSPEYQKTRAKKGINQTRKVNLQFTGQMRKDFKLRVIGNNQYGSGFDNPANFEKSVNVEDLYRGKIFELSKEEEKLIETLYAQELERNFR
jgi:hypothetical protein